MESGMMKVVFASIINGSPRDLPANEAKCTSRETTAKPEKRFKPEIQYSVGKIAADGFQEKTSREVFAALVNASNCANLHMDNELEGFLTLTPHESLLRKCH